MRRNSEKKDGGRAITTIAIDKNGYAAADGLRIWGGDIASITDEKLRIRHGRIYAMTGSFPLFEPLITWHYEQNADPEKVPKIGGDIDWTLIVIERPGIVIKYSYICPYPEEFKPPIAFGAGLDLAKGAMLWGASAEEAVKLVAAHTNHTGGRVQVVNIAEALGQLLEAAE